VPDHPSSKSSPVSAAAWVTAIIAVASLAETPPVLEPQSLEFDSAMYQAVRPAPPSARVAQQIADVRDGGRVNVNAADAQTLQLLPGVGPVVSARVIADREANGPYPTLEALTRVSGIGPRTIERISALAFAGPGPGASPAGEEPGHTEPGLHVQPVQHVGGGLEGQVAHPHVEPER
jgi:competence ComEA-like helix-hairpin-helix protein